MKSRIGLLLAIAAALAVAAGCGGGDDGAAATGGDAGGETSGLPTDIGPGEGQLNLIAWEGYTESGENDKAYDWVTPFEKETGCKVNVKYGASSDEMVQLMRSGGGANYDGVSASGDATLRLIAAGDVAELNPDLIPSFPDFSEPLQRPPHNTVDGRVYGISYTWGANVLMYDTSVVKEAPTSWAPVFDGTSYAGKVTAYDSPNYIADAALYLKSAQPDLGIDDPYELTEEQLDAAVDILKTQRQQIGKYWTTYSDEIQLFKQGDAVIGQAWPYQVNTLQDDGEPVESVLPEEGATGWADSWMMSANAPHPNCMYKWMAYASTPAVQQKVAEWFGASPANAKTCDLLGQDFCTKYHVTDQEYFDNVAFWKTPLADCGNGETNCTDYSLWTQKWAEIKG
jgi:putative spermidine/putrescine transport system substrate-binding protein